jgi:hypothetical protein
MDETTIFWSESNAGSHHGVEARLLMKPTRAGAGLGMPPELTKISAHPQWVGGNKAVHYFHI